jgi:hypothetical protein
MFFGREEEFAFIRETFLKEKNGKIMTLAGERRSGKTSILFQIMNGRLGEGFSPFFIDMQAMAGIINTSQFLQKIAQSIWETYDLGRIEFHEDGNEFLEFESVIKLLHGKYAYSRIVFLIDEYEIIEKKIDEGKINQSIIPLCSLLMDRYNVMFLFTGSNKLENRKASYWKELIGRAISKKIPYLNKKDCRDLITKPMENFAFYSNEQIEKIYRLFAGQPFYVQNICRNIIDHLISNERNSVTDKDIDDVISEILNHPVPQMIYFWQDFTRDQMIILSLLGEIINSDVNWVEINDIMQWLKNHDLNQIISPKEITNTLEEIYQKEILTKTEDGFCFTMDFFRLWIQQEQNIWKICNEFGLT